MMKVVVGGQVDRSAMTARRGERTPPPSTSVESTVRVLSDEVDVVSVVVEVVKGSMRREGT